MSLSDDLEKLRTADPATYKMYSSGSLGEYCSQDPDFPEDENDHDIDIDNLNGDGKAAWLQFCLQRACAIRGWALKQFFFVREKQYCLAEIEKPIASLSDYHHEGLGDSPAAALLAAYLECVQVT